jgi:hypothetical protein
MSRKNSNSVEKFSSLSPSPSPSPSNTLSIQIPKHNETYNSKNTGTTAASSSSSSSGKSVRKYDSRKKKPDKKWLDWVLNKLNPKKPNHAKVYAAVNTVRAHSNKNTKSDIPKIEECKVYLKDVIDSVSRNDIRKNIVTAQETCQAVLDICKKKVEKVEEDNLKYDINDTYKNFENAKRYRQEKKLRGIGYGGKKTRKLRKRGKKNAKLRKTRRHR